MNILNYKQFVDNKLAFMNSHNNDFTVDTSSMNEYGEYHKTYIFADGAQMTECMRPVYEDVEVEVRGVKIKVSVKLFETELWNSDDATSIFYYEKFNHTKEARV